METKYILLLALLVTFTYSLRSSNTVESHKQEMMTGAYSDQDPQSLGNDLKQIDGYLKEKFPNLNNWQLTKAETQVVEGINYRYTYSQQQTSVSYEFTVWDRPWLQSRQITSIKKIVQTKNEQGKDIKKIKTFTPNGNDDQWTDKVNGLFE